jgi:hypothetical protein
MGVAFIFEAEKGAAPSPELGLIFGGDGFILPVTSDSGRITAVPVAAGRLRSHGNLVANQSHGVDRPRDHPVTCSPLRSHRGKDILYSEFTLLSLPVFSRLRIVLTIFVLRPRKIIMVFY